MQGKFIISAYCLRRVLKDADLDLSPKREDILIRCTCKELTIGESKIKAQVEAKNDFEVKVSVGQLRKLSKVMGILEDQPIVLYIEENKWINIQNAVI